jgi:hypothetical protein
MEEVKKVIIGRGGGKVRVICNYCKTRMCLLLLLAVLVIFAVILDHARGNLLLRHHLPNHICILILMAMFSVLSTILMLLGLSLLV